MQIFLLILKYCTMLGLEGERRTALRILASDLGHLFQVCDRNNMALLAPCIIFQPTVNWKIVS